MEVVNLPNGNERQIAQKFNLPLEEVISHRRAGKNYCKVCKYWLSNEQMSGKGLYCAQHYEEKQKRKRR